MLFFICFVEYRISMDDCRIFKNFFLHSLLLEIGDPHYLVSAAVAPLSHILQYNTLPTVFKNIIK